MGKRIEIRSGDRALDVAGEEAGGGLRFALALPPEGSTLTVRLCGPDQGCGRPWSLGIAPPEAPAWFEELNALQKSGRTEEARRRLERLRKTAPAREQGQILRLLAFLNPGDKDSLRRGIAVDRARGCLSGEAENVTRLARLLIVEGRFQDAQRLLDSLRLPGAAPAGSKFLAAYYRGLLAQRIGDYRHALERLRQAVDLAERVGILQYRWKAEQFLAVLLQELGRTGEASGLFARLRADPHPETPCDLGNLLTNEAWTRLVAREGGERTADPIPELEQARNELDGHACLDSQRLNARLNLALAYQQEERWPESRKMLDEAEDLGVEPNLAERLWRYDLEGRLAIAEGRPARALDLYEELDRRAGLVLSSEGRLRAALGLAKARLALGRRAEAMGALEEADRRVDEESWSIPAQEGRDTFLAQREEPTQLYLQLLLEDGQRQRAFDVARLSRSRLLRQIAVRDCLTQLKPREQQLWTQLLSDYRTLREEIDREAASRWSDAGDEEERAGQERTARLARSQAALDRALASLSGAVGVLWEQPRLKPPQAGEVVLAYHPLPGGRWVGFAATPLGVETSTFELPAKLPGAPDLSRRLLVPFRSALEKAERIRILPEGRLRSVDFHALPFAGEPLLARHLVTYSLDLPVGTARLDTAPETGGAALLVADPQDDLPEARKEAVQIASAVRAWGPAWRLERLEGSDAGSGRVLRSLPGATLFHYAGHGRFAGFAGWDSALPLADESRLSLGDVLIRLHPAPAWVVLSSCDAGRSSEEAPGEGISLANAFLLAGSRAVVAAPRQVADRAARDLLTELYRSWRPGGDLPGKLRDAQLACRRRTPSADWASFRVFVP